MAGNLGGPLSPAHNALTTLKRVRVLVAEDERRVADAVARGLRREGMAVDVAYDGGSALDKARMHSYDVLVLDRDLPVVHGDDLCRTLRREEPDSRVLMLTAAAGVVDLVDGLSIGADDYMPKPFEPRELVARIQAVLRRGVKIEDGDTVRAGALEVSFATGSAHLEGRPLALTTAEFALLGLFVRNRGRILSRDRILEETRGVDWESYDRSIDVLVSRLRQKLGDDPRQPAFIRTVRGAGYRFIGGMEDGGGAGDD
jgi:DNA-binding response OmpR family regulator